MRYSGRVLITAVTALMVAGGCVSSKPPTTPTPTPAPAFNIELKADKPVYRAGEFIYITVRATQECFLSVYDISTLGEVTQIFPNRYAADNKIQGNIAYRIPAASDKFDFEVTGPPGTERVRAVCTKQNVNLFKDRQLKSDSSEIQVFPQISDKQAPFEKDLENQKNQVPSNQWTEASITFQVQ